MRYEKERVYLQETSSLDFSASAPTGGYFILSMLLVQQDERVTLAARWRLFDTLIAAHPHVPRFEGGNIALQWRIEHADESSRVAATLVRSFTPSSAGGHPCTAHFVIARCTTQCSALTPDVTVAIPLYSIR